MFKFLKLNSRASWVFYWLSIMAAFILIPALMGYELWDEVDYFNLSNLKIPFPWGLIFVVLWYSLYCADSIISYDKKNGWRLRRVETGKIGMIMFAGQQLLEIEEGLAIILRGWFELRMDPLPPRKHRVVVEKIETASPDQVKYEKLRIRREDYKNDELHVRMSIGAVFNVFSQLEKGKYKYYVTNVGSDEKFEELALDIVRGFAKEEFSPRTAAIINNQIEEINESMRKKLQAEIDRKNQPETSWGLKIPKIQLADLLLPDSIVEKMTLRVMTSIEKGIEIIGAEAKSKVMKIESRAEKYKEIQLGMGKAEAQRMMLEALAVGRRLMLLAEATGYGKIAKALNMKEGDFILQMEMLTRTLKEVMPNSDYTFIGSSDFANMFGFMKLIQGGLTKLGIGSGAPK